MHMEVCPVSVHVANISYMYVDSCWDQCIIWWVIIANDNVWVFHSYIFHAQPAWMIPFKLEVNWKFDGVDITSQTC